MIFGIYQLYNSETKEEKIESWKTIIGGFIPLFNFLIFYGFLLCFIAGMPSIIIDYLLNKLIKDDE